MNREPCRVSDDPSYDYSDYIENEGVYAQPLQENPDDAYDTYIFNKSFQTPQSKPSTHTGDTHERNTPNKTK